MQPIFESLIDTLTEVIYLISSSSSSSSYVALASLDFKLSVNESGCQCSESYFLRLSVNTIITGNTSYNNNSCNATNSSNAGNESNASNTSDRSNTINTRLK